MGYYVPFTAAAQETEQGRGDTAAVAVAEHMPDAAGEMRYTLAECLEMGLERNFDIRIVRNRGQEAANNATLGNAGALPSADLSGGYSGTVNNTRQELAAGGSTTANGVSNSTLNAGVNLGWTIFNGFSIRAGYKKLQELQLLRELDTREAV